MSNVPIHAKVRMPVDSTRQAEGILWGALGVRTHRWTGMVIMAFIVAHLVGQGIYRIPALEPVQASADLAWMWRIQWYPWARALLFASVSFHFFYGLKLIVADLGWRVNHRVMYAAIAAVSLFFGLKELLAYV